MPTGFTQKIYEGVDLTLKGFATEIFERNWYREMPEYPVKPREFYLKTFREYEAELQELRSLTEAQIKERAEADYAKAFQYYEQAKTSREEIRTRYRTVETLVQAWNPPAELLDLKKMMLDQIHKSREFDCPDLEEPKWQSPQEWYQHSLNCAERLMDSYRKQVQEETDRVLKTNAYIEAFHREFG